MHQAGWTVALRLNEGHRWDGPCPDTCMPDSTLCNSIILKKIKGDRVWEQEDACVELSVNQFEISYRYRTVVHSTHYSLPQTFSNIKTENTRFTVGRILFWNQKMATENNILGRVLFLSSFLYASYYGSYLSFPKYPTLHLIIVEVTLLIFCEFGPLSNFLARKMCHSLR